MLTDRGKTDSCVWRDDLTKTSVMKEGLGG